MKNLLIYINPYNNFFHDTWKNENESLIKVQIDNSLELGWKKEDILLITNFDYTYNNIKSLIIDKNNYCPFSSGTPTKINALLSLFEQGIIKNDLYWFHDIDAFQLEKITESELKLGDFDLGLTNYGPTTMNLKRGERPSTGSIFFKKSSKDIFEWIKIKVYQYQCNEEVALLELTKIKKYNLKERIKRLNISYNFATRKRDISLCYDVAIKPLKVIHFHPFDKRHVELEGDNDNISVCLYGKNRLNTILVNERLKKIFNKHGIK